MLYERWRQIARERRNEIALRDFASGQSWTFAALAEQAERDGAPSTASARWSSRFSVPPDKLKLELQPALEFPQGTNAEFLFTVLCAWRSGKIVCPLEPEHSPPTPGEMPAGCAHLKITSATTGVARVIAFTAEQLAADAENIVATMGLRPDWPNLGVISLAHSYGFSNLVTPLLLHGIPLILAPAPLPETVRRAATLAEHITLPAVPAMWRAWHEAGAIPPNTRLAISAGAPLPLALEQEVFTKRGLKIHNFYGASECGGIAYDAVESPRADAACAGAPMKNVRLSVAADGCLEVRSRAVGQTYLPPDATLADGCFHTSDLADIVSKERELSQLAAREKMACSGKCSTPDDISHAASWDNSRSEIQVFLRGRANDQINVAGRKVSPESIERALLKHPQVLECLVFGVPSADAERTEEIAAVIVSSEREEVLRRFALESMPAWQAPRHWWFVEALRTNSRGKTPRAHWRQIWLANNGAPNS